MIDRVPCRSDRDERDRMNMIACRTAYATIVEGWLKADSKKILEGEYKAVPVVKKA